MFAAIVFFYKLDFNWGFTNLNLYIMVGVYIVGFFVAVCFTFRGAPFLQLLA